MRMTCFSYLGSVGIMVAFELFFTFSYDRESVDMETNCDYMKIFISYARVFFELLYRQSF